MATDLQPRRGLTPTSDTVAPAKKSRSYGRKPWGAILLFLGPIMLYYLIFILYPLGATVYYSLHRIEPLPNQQGLTTRYVGFEVPGKREGGDR